VIKHGAFDYITKPLFPEEILVTIKKAISLSNGPAATVNGNEQPAKEKLPVFRKALNGKQNIPVNIFSARAMNSGPF
jgi:FixJ family two-component response regulator